MHKMAFSKKTTDGILNQVVFEDPFSTTEQVLPTMKNSFTKIYLGFMSYTLGLMTSFNELFQSNKPLLYKLKPETERFIKTLCMNYMDITVIRETDIFRSDHKNQNNFVPMENIYLVRVSGHCGMIQLAKKGNSYICYNRSRLYIELISNIKQRFTFEDDIYQYLNIVDPFPLTGRFPALNETIQIQVLDDEWRQHPLLDLSSLNLNLMINLLLVLPFSNDSVERVFSSLINIKTDKRSCSSDLHCTRNFDSKDAINLEGGCVRLEPTQKIYSGKWHEGNTN
nr:unnamed protein product [Callosobruchus analis]